MAVSLLRRVFRKLRERAGLTRASAPPSLYGARWDEHARALPDADAVGGGPFDVIGRLELGFLRLAGLQPHHTIVDLGCGAGRLAVQVIPALEPQGHYLGLDVSPTMLQRAQARVHGLGARARCRVTWVKVDGVALPVPDQSVDILSAFSVFTHIEHEDTFRYLKDARRAVRPGGRFVYSCLTTDDSLARHVFLVSAADELDLRWRKIRNVMTSVDLMDAIARMAGWEPLRWYRGDEPIITLPDMPGSYPLCQSVCVLEAAAGAAPVSDQPQR